ncbi:GerAB/ArcD/ProY family transporter [Orenia marismortui]|uniref:Spore germination protein (Amino acid permease) n=1 Tax=Orenia marismortui TaxID=46469 RepID=A0A4R8H202_9FIRM|nr:GerAB/ArcD/ProY family transporter [Orenia marismortui]TDX48454.1 spore germination protein (amino acid permease) [Orenia marismortui]
MEEKISAYQVFWLVIAIIIPTIILSVPAIAVGLAEEGACLTIVVAGSLALVLHYLILKLGCDFSNKSVVEDAKQIFGSVLGRIIVFPYVALIIYDITTILSQTIEFIQFFMPRTFILGVWIGITLLIIYLLYNGIENIARAITITLFSLVVVIIMVMLLNYPNYNTELRVFVMDFKKILQGSIYAFSWFILPPISLLFLKEFFKNNNKAIKASLLGNFLCQVIIFTLIIVCIIVFGIDLTQVLSYPFYSLGTLIVEGLGVAIFVAWIAGNIVKVSIYYFITIKGIKVWFELKEWKILNIPFSIMVMAIAMFQSQTPLFNVLNMDYFVIGYLVIQVPSLLMLSIGYLAANKNT